MGLNASNTTELILENVKVPKENLLGKRGQGFKQFLIAFDGEELGLARWLLVLPKLPMKKL